MSKEMHFKEDTSKPENRVNLTLFHLLANREINSFLKKRLEIPENSIIFPAPNLATEEFDTCLRPDFEITLDGRTIGYIEVELGPEDYQQLNRYRENFNPIYSIVGKKEYPGADLSLEEIYEFVRSIAGNYKDTQTLASMKLFANLIKYYIIEGNFFSDKKRQVLSDTMKESVIVKSVYEHLGKERIIENGSVKRGMLMFNTVKESGFSLRVHSPNTGSGGLSLMARSGGSDKIIFPNSQKLQKYLPHKTEEVNKFVNLLEQLGFGEIRYKSGEERVMADIRIIEANISKICEAIGAIAGCIMLN